MRGIRIPVHLGERSYDILVTRDHYSHLGIALKRLGVGRRALIVTNRPVRRKHGKDLEKTLRQAQISYTFFDKFPPDERAKSLDSVHRLIRELMGVTADHLICFGGGVLGDLTGFTAAIYKRGIPYIQVPTTLLAQVDSAIGGKTAVDLPEAKNFIGAFYQPRLVYSDLKVLEDLPDRNFQDGLAEAIKYGMIQDRRFFGFIETHAKRLLDREAKPLGHLVSTCSRVKASVVEADEYDKKGKRILLNYGHTLGHALEQVVGYRMNHGRAISVGMLLAADISKGLGLLKKEEIRRLEELLRRVGLPITLKELDSRRRWNLNRILLAEGRDKKFVHDKNRYVLPIRIGKVVVKEGIPYPLIRHVLKKRLT